MSSITKKSVAPLCKQIASEYEGWQYAGERFSNKTLKHSILYIDPLWSFTLSAQPVVMLVNKKANKLSLQIDDEKEMWISKKTVLRPDATLETQVYRKFVHTMREAEVYIRDFFKRGLNIIQQYYHWQDEEELLTNMPMNLEGFVGIGYCLSRVILHDFDFVRRYINDEIKTITPKSTSIHEIKKMLPVWEKNYLETGSVFGKK